MSVLDCCSGYLDSTLATEPPAEHSGLAVQTLNAAGGAVGKIYGLRRPVPLLHLFGKLLLVLNSQLREGYVLFVAPPGWQNLHWELDSFFNVTPLTLALLKALKDPLVPGRPWLDVIDDTIRRSREYFIRLPIKPFADSLPLCWVQNGLLAPEKQDWCFVDPCTVDDVDLPAVAIQVGKVKAHSIEVQFPSLFLSNLEAVYVRSALSHWERVPFSQASPGTVAGPLASVQWEIPRPHWRGAVRLQFSLNAQVAYSNTLQIRCPVVPPPPIPVFRGWLMEIQPAKEFAGTAEADGYRVEILSRDGALTASENSRSTWELGPQVIVVLDPKRLSRFGFGC